MLKQCRFCNNVAIGRIGGGWCCQNHFDWRIDLLHNMFSNPLNPYVTEYEKAIIKWIDKNNGRIHIDDLANKREII